MNSCNGGTKLSGLFFAAKFGGTPHQESEDINRKLEWTRNVHGCYMAQSKTQQMCRPQGIDGQLVGLKQPFYELFGQQQPPEALKTTRDQKKKQTRMPQKNGLVDHMIYLESQKRKIVWSLREKAVMISFFGKILFPPAITQKNCQIKRTLQSYSARSKT